MSKSVIRFSIIIPTKGWNNNLEECLSQCKKLDYTNYEIIVLPDDELHIDGIRVVATGPVSPGEKRNIGVKNANGEIIAFIDDDAYPRKDWLKSAEKYLLKGVKCVGGPQLTPESEGILEKASGSIYSSTVGGGGLSYEYNLTEIKEVEEQSSCNLIIVKEIALNVGGFSKDIWPGEDSLFCRDLKKIGYKILFAPDVVIFHHRRPLFKPHLRQIWWYGLQRGQLTKTSLRTSLLKKYVFPSIFIIGAIIGIILSLQFPAFLPIYLIGMIGYIFIVIANSLVLAIKAGSIQIAILTFSGIILTHITYGLSFIVGLLKKKKLGDSV